MSIPLMIDMIETRAIFLSSDPWNGFDIIVHPVAMQTPYEIHQYFSGPQRIHDYGSYLWARKRRLAVIAKSKNKVKGFRNRFESIYNDTTS